jgi:hypothetical protein
VELFHLLMATEQLTTALHVSTDAGCKAAIFTLDLHKREKEHKDRTIPNA